MWEFFYCFIFKIKGDNYFEFPIFEVLLKKILSYVSRLNVSMCLENFTLLEYSFRGYICFSGEVFIRQRIFKQIEILSYSFTVLF